MNPLDVARLGAAYATSLAAYAVGGTPRPFSASFSVTDRCNLRCAYCNFPNLADRELTTAEIGTLFERLWRMGIRRLGIVGGEPMVRKDLPAILQLAKQKGFFLTVNSNLTLFDRVPDALGAADLILTSLDGDGSQAEHERERGDGSHDGVLAAIETLVRRGQRVVAISVVRDADVDVAKRLLERAAKLGIGIHFQAQCVDAPVVRGALPPGLVNAHMRHFWQELEALRREGAAIASSGDYLQALARWPDFRQSARLVAGERCAAGRGFLFIDPVGRGWPCAYTRGVAGSVDLLADSWAESWSRETPCNTCSVGPMLEFNVLFKRPLSAASNALASYLL